MAAGIVLLVWGLIMVAGGLAAWDGVGAGAAMVGGILFAIGLWSVVPGRRQQRPVETRQEALSALPDDLRPRGESLALWVVGVATTLVSTTTAAVLPKAVSALLVFAVGAGWLGFFLVRERRRTRAVIELVKKRAHTMATAELQSLVERLETVYSPRQMRPLRRMVSADVAD